MPAIAPFITLYNMGSFRKWVLLFLFEQSEAICSFILKKEGSSQGNLPSASVVSHISKTDHWSALYDSTINKRSSLAGADNNVLTSSKICKRRGNESKQSYY